MAKDFAQAFYDSPAWKHTRKAYAASVGYVCEDCFKKGLIAPGRVVHHITPITSSTIDDPDVTLNWANLRLVCQDCHAAEHRKNAGKRYQVLDDGSVVIE